MARDESREGTTSAQKESAYGRALVTLGRNARTLALRSLPCAIVAPLLSRRINGENAGADGRIRTGDLLITKGAKTLTTTPNCVSCEESAGNGWHRAAHAPQAHPRS